MGPNFTLELLSFIYQELSREENREIIERIGTEADVNDEYQELMSLIELLDMPVMKPRKKIVDRIISYSKETAGKFM